MLPGGIVSTTEKMTIDERFKYLRRMKRRYWSADRNERGLLLDEMEAVTELHRKSIVRLMNGKLERTSRRVQRGRTYGPEVEDAIRVIAESVNYICAERLTPNLSWLAGHLARHDELEVSAQLLRQLDEISVSTVQRILARVGQDEPRLPRQGPCAANSVTRDVPMRRIPWDEQQPGHFEMDLVHHSGSSASGEYVCTIQMIDVATGWSERRAVLGRSFRVMKDALQCILARLPFPVLEVHPDNGSEFFNHHMHSFWHDTLRPFQLSRSRPYQKNDNRIVEQKNSTLVRAYLGSERLDTVNQTLALNHLYDRMWLYYNFFQPVMHLMEKLVIRKEGQPTQIKRRHDTARTPFDRLCTTTAIAEERRIPLHTLRERTNPRQLHDEINDLIEDLFSLPGATPGASENVYHTMTYFSEEDADTPLLAFREPATPHPVHD